MREPTLDFSPTTPTSDTDPRASLRTRLVVTTTTEYVTTTTKTPTTTTVPDTSTTTAAVATTDTSEPKATSPSTTTPPPPTTTTTAAQGGYHSGHEASFVSKINSQRSASSLGALSRNSSLDSEARAWSKHLAQQGALSHSGIGRLIPPWTGVGENVGSGPSVSAIYAALASSSTHLNNILGNYDHVGVGVWVDANGTLWTTHIFAR